MPGLGPRLSGLIPADGARGLSTSGLPTVRAYRDTVFGAPASPRFPRSSPPPSWPDSFRPSTSCGIAVRAGRERAGGPTWMPGTGPGMTILGGERRADHDGRRSHRRFLSADCLSTHPHKPTKRAQPGHVRFKRKRLTLAFLSSWSAKADHPRVFKPLESKTKRGRSAFADHDGRERTKRFQLKQTRSSACRHRIPISPRTRAFAHSYCQFVLVVVSYFLRTQPGAGGGAAEL